MKYFINFLPLLTLTLVSHAAETMYHDVALFLDVTFEKPDSRYPVITRDLAFGVCQKSYPIITTSNLLSNFLSIQSAKKDDALQTQIAQVPFNLKEWAIYTPKEGHFYLLIPLQVKSDGFQIGKLTKINSEQTLDNFAASIKKTQMINIEELTSIFLPGKDEAFGMWNIYLVGHGLYPEKLQESLINEKEKRFFGGATEQDVSGATIAGLTVTQFRALLQFFTNNINVNFLYYMSCYGGDNNLILPYISKIVGERTIQGAQGEQKISVLKNIVQPNFTIVAGSLTSATVLAAEDSITSCMRTQAEEKTAKEKLEQGGKIDIAQFFKLLRVRHEGISRILYKKNELQSILKEVTIRNTTQREDPYGISGLPSILFPGTDKFIAFPITDKIVILTDVFLAQYQDTISKVLQGTKDVGQPKQSIEIIDKEAVLLYAVTIPVDIQITVKKGKPAPAIASMVPGTSLHWFKKISIPVPFTEFITQSFGTVTTEFTKNYFIEELNILNDTVAVESQDKEITLHNVLISQTKEKTASLEKHPIKVFFTYNNTIYFKETNEYGKLDLQPSSALVPFTRMAEKNDLKHALINYYTFDQALIQEIIDSAAAQKMLEPADIKFIKEHISKFKSEHEQNIKEFNDLYQQLDKLFMELVNSSVKRIHKKDSSSSKTLKQKIMYMLQQYLPYVALDAQLHETMSTLSPLMQAKLTKQYDLDKPKKLDFSRILESGQKAIRFKSIPRKPSFTNFVQLVADIGFIDWLRTIKDLTEIDTIVEHVYQTGNIDSQIMQDAKAAVQKVQIPEE